MRTVLLISLLVLFSARVFGQSLELVPTQLIIPAKFQPYYDTARTVNLPKGFSISLFYTGQVSGPRFMDFTPSGILCVADQNNSSVLALPDMNADGIADTAIILASGTENSHSIAFHNGS